MFLLLGLLLCYVPFSSGSSTDFSGCNFMAAAPYTYTHVDGGGAVNDRTIGEYSDVVESLEGRQEKCGDLISYLLLITMATSNFADDNYLDVNLEFLADSTGQPGVALSPFDKIVLNKGDKIENGDSGVPPNGGVKTFGFDSAYKDSKTQMSISNVVYNTPTLWPVTGKSENQKVAFRVNGLNPGDVCVVRIDVKLSCKKGSNPSGNLQASLISTAANDRRSVSGGGQQTIPLKTVANIQGLTECIPSDAVAPLVGVDFTAKVVVTNPTMSNSGSYTTSFYYSWTNGGYLIDGTTTTGIKSIHTYDLYCTYLHRGEYLYTQGTCGCESTFIDNAQPQFFYDVNGKYYSAPSTTPVNIRDIPCIEYIAIDSTSAIRRLYLRADDNKTPVRSIMLGGNQFDFYDVVFVAVAARTFESPAVPCKCSRSLDIVIVYDQSNRVTTDAFLATKTFIKNVADDFNIGNANFGLISYDSTQTTTLPLVDGTTSTNVYSKISSLSCTVKLTSKGISYCGSTDPIISSAINAGLNLLKTSQRGATQILIVLATDWLLTDADKILAAATSVFNSGIKIYGVIYNSNMAKAEQLKIVANKEYYWTERYDWLTLQETDVEDITTKICKENQYPCGSSCCGVCDTACGTCKPVTTCLNPVNTCAKQTQIVGSCCQVVDIPDACQTTTLTSQCKKATCNSVSGVCDVVETCKAIDPKDMCYDYICDAGTCKQQLKQLSDACNARSCDTTTNPWSIKTVLTNCGKSNACNEVKCDPALGCITTPIADTQTSSDECNPRVCDPISGWKNVPVDCSTNDPCIIGTCIKGVCTFSNVADNCKDTSKGLCRTTTCNNGQCEVKDVLCPDRSQFCEVLDNATYPSTGGCNPQTGQCVYKKTVCPSDKCNATACTNNVCSYLPTAGCGDTTCCTGTSDFCTKYRCDTTAKPSPKCVTSTTDCSTQAPTFCHTNGVCDPSKGCTFTETTTCPASNECKVAVRDPSKLGCCFEIDKNCDKGDPCYQYSCDPKVAGGCVSKYLCTSADPCKISQCTPTGCVVTDVKCTSPNSCFKSQCVNGSCVNTNLCSDNNPCTVDTCDVDAGKCVNTLIVCDDNTVCTKDVCSEGSCAFSTLTCDDNVPCTVDSCDPVKGCSNVPDDDLCQPPDRKCQSSYCHPTEGCKVKPITCPPSGRNCLNSTCIPFEGCKNVSYVCNKTVNLAPGLDNTPINPDCVFISCETKSGRCVAQPLQCGAGIVSTGLIVGSALAAGAVVGIVIGVAAFFAFAASGTALAYHQTNKDDDNRTVSQNPLYVENKVGGNNPLHRASYD